MPSAHRDSYRPTGGTVLVVDDQPDNLLLIQEILESDGFTVQLASDGEEALASVKASPPDCIVLDAMMPILDGFEVCRRLKKDRSTHFIPVVMLTALATTDDKVIAYKAGADEFLNKPVNMIEVRARVRSMVQIKRLRDDLDGSESIILSMIEALESKDPRVAGHSQRVAATAIQLAQRLALPQETVATISKGAILHDIGKIGLAADMPDTLDKRTEQKRAAFEEHAEIGERILAPFLSFAPVRAMVRHHHERLDGSGFPDRLEGAELIPEIEIVALANHWDDLHTALADEKAVASRMRSDAAEHLFHAEMVETLLREIDRQEILDAATAWQDLLPFPGPVGPGKILLAISDNPSLRSLRYLLIAAQHEVVECRDGRQVFDLLRQSNPDVLLLQADLDGITGMELSLEIKTRPETELLPVILVTQRSEKSLQKFSPRVGADDFLFLPVNQYELLARVSSLLRLSTYFKDLEEIQSVILSLGSALESKDSYTRGHSERVGVLAAKLGRTMNLEEAECRILRTAGQIHDIGKIGLPYELLNKDGSLDSQEFEVVMQHPEAGERICRPLRTLRPALPYIRHHHERHDGSGYPDGLAGDAIPLGARILGLADAYDALTSARSYRSNFSPVEAIEMLGRETRAELWDGEVFAALTELVRRG
jgi:putative two-component system response regulator